MERQGWKKQLITIRYEADLGERVTLANVHIKVFCKEFCPPLEESLFLAISSEYDLDVPEQRRNLIELLSPLKKAALEETNAEFDPSGSGGFRAIEDDYVSAPSHSTSEDKSSSNVTSITTALSDLQVDGRYDIGTDLENLSQEDKVKWLKDTFQNIPPFEVTSTLTRCHGNLNHTVDRLLTHSFLPKGVDGFGQDENSTPARKGRNKKKPRTTESSRASSVASKYSESSTETANNIWASVAEDVEFICARTTLDAKSVKSTYHANRMSLPATIRALAVKQAAKLPALADIEITIQIRVADLKQDFQSVPEVQLYGLLDLARNIPSAAHELAREMVTIIHADTIPVGLVSGFVQYTPVKVDTDADRPSTPTRWTSAPSSVLANQTLSVASSSLAASAAFQQASSAYKRGKSDRLMGGAAAYYSSVGHEYAKLAKQQAAAEANAHVEAQSSATHVDLHGVSVVDAIRIARDRTEHWWDALGDTKHYTGGNNAARAGFRIVTGVGKHSRDSALRIGPAVSKMLMREGWRAEVLAGEIIVKGKAKQSRSV